MYRGGTHPAKVDGRRVCYGKVVRDESKRMRLSAPVELPKKTHKGPPPKWGLEYCKRNAKDFQFFADTVSIKPKHRNKDIFEDESLLELVHPKIKSNAKRVQQGKTYHQPEQQHSQTPIKQNIGTFNNQLQHCPSVVELEVIKESIHSLKSKKRKSNAENSFLERQYIEQKRQQICDEFYQLEHARIGASQSFQSMVNGRATLGRSYNISERDRLCKKFLEEREKARASKHFPRNTFQQLKHDSSTSRRKETLSQCATALKKLNEIEGEVAFGLGQPQKKCKKHLLKKSIATIKQFLPVVDQFTCVNSGCKASDDSITLQSNVAPSDRNVIILQTSAQLHPNHRITHYNEITQQPNKSTDYVATSQQVYYYGQNQVALFPSNVKSTVASSQKYGILPSEYSQNISQFVDHVIKEEPIYIDNSDSKRVRLSSRDINSDMHL